MSTAEPNLWTPNANKQTLATSQALAQYITKVRREERWRAVNLARALFPEGPELDAFIDALVNPSEAQAADRSLPTSE